MITLRDVARHDRADATAIAPIRPERVRPDLRVVEEGTTTAQGKGKGKADHEARTRSASGVVATLLVILLFICVFGVVVFQVFLVQTQSHLDQLNRDIATQENHAKDLRLQTTDLEAPDRIVKDAKGRLGMIAPGDVVWLQPGAGDDSKAAFDPSKEAPPVAAPVTTQSPAGAPTYGAASNSAATPSSGAKGTTTPTTKWTPSNATPSNATPSNATPSTVAKSQTTATTPTTAAPKSAATVARPTTTTRTR